MLSYLTHDVEGIFVITCEDVGLPIDENRSIPREQLYASIQTREDPRFAVDMTAIEYLSSADIGVLITIKRRVDARHGKVVLFAVHTFVRDVLHTMRLFQFFTIADDWPDAVKHLSS